MVYTKFCLDHKRVVTWLLNNSRKAFNLERDQDGKYGYHFTADPRVFNRIVKMKPSSAERRLNELKVNYKIDYYRGVYKDTPPVPFTSDRKKRLWRFTSDFIIYLQAQKILFKKRIFVIHATRSILKVNNQLKKSKLENLDLNDLQEHRKHINGVHQSFLRQGAFEHWEYFKTGEDISRHLDRAEKELDRLIFKRLKIKKN